MRIGHIHTNWWGVEASRSKFKHSLNLFSRYIVLLNDFPDARTDFQIFKNRSHRHPGIFENPRAAAPARDTLHGGAL